jgi:hypothetical protein
LAKIDLAAAGYLTSTHVPPGRPAHRWHWRPQRLGPDHVQLSDSILHCSRQAEPVRHRQAGLNLLDQGRLLWLAPRQRLVVAPVRGDQAASRLKLCP